MMREACRIIAVRHGQTSWNVGGRMQGRIDIALNEEGHRQAACTAQALAGEELHAIYSSDLSRARQTAEPLAQALGLPLNLEAGLRERSFGACEGKTFAEIEVEQPEQARRWRARDPHFRPGDPGDEGESLAMVYERVVSTLSRLAAAHAGQQIAVFSHGGVMDMLYRAASRIPLDAPRTWGLSNTAINRVLYNGEGFSLVGWGDVAHLEATGASIFPA